MSRLGELLMMSIGSVKSAGSAGNYYTDKDNYYVIGSMDERWQGKGAEALGIDGKAVDKALFTELLKGKLPDGSDLTRIQDGANRHRPGYDLTFSAPKSVSVMAMLGGDKRLIDAHNQAVTEAVRQLETLAATRVMTDGKSETVLTGNLIVAKFNHDTNRNQNLRYTPMPSSLTPRRTGTNGSLSAQIRSVKQVLSRTCTRTR